MEEDRAANHLSAFSLSFTLALYICNGFGLSYKPDKVLTITILLVPPLIRPKLPRPFSAKRAFFDKIAALKQAKEMREAEERKLAKKTQDEKKQRLKELQKQIKDSKKKQIRITKKMSKNYRLSSF